MSKKVNKGSHDPQKAYEEAKREALLGLPEEEEEEEEEENEDEE